MKRINMLFPKLDSQKLNADDTGVLKMIEASYNEAITMNMGYWNAADLDMRFYCGDQSVWNEVYGSLPGNTKRNYAFNKIRTMIDMPSGHQRKTRKSIIVTPVENADDQTADQFTKIMLWIAQQENMLETISDAFHSSLITGMSLLKAEMDYREDPVSGNIKINKYDYNSYIIDPYFKKKDFSDCRYIYSRSYVTPRDAISLMPEHEEEILSMPGLTNGGRDGKFQYMAQNYGYSYKNLLAYDEYYYLTYRNQRMLIDTDNGEVLEWTGDDDALRQFLSTYPQVIAEDHEIPTVNVAYVLQGKVMYDGPQPNGGLDRYPHVPVLAYYHPEIPYFDFRVQGMVRGLRDAQYLFNRQKIIQLDMFESQLRSGIIYKEDALVNPNDAFMTGAGKGLAVKRTASMGDVVQIQSPRIDPSIFELSSQLGSIMGEISGVNEELLGSADDMKAGVLSMLRQGAGVTTLQLLFDNLDVAQRELGQIIIELIQKNFTPGKVQKIIGFDQEISPQFYNKSFGRYQAAVEDGINTATQRQMQFAQLIQLREVGVPIPDDQLLEAATLQNKAELVQRIREQQAQAQQAQQKQAELEMANIQAQIELAKARTIADEGLGYERLSRIKENQQLANERQSQAEENRTDAMLNRIKAFKEIEEIDVAQIEKFINLAQLLKREEEAAAAERMPAPEIMPQELGQGGPSPFQAQMG